MGAVLHMVVTPLPIQAIRNAHSQQKQGSCHMAEMERLEVFTPAIKFPTWTEHELFTHNPHGPLVSWPHCKEGQHNNFNPPVCLEEKEYRIKIWVSIRILCHNLSQEVSKNRSMREPSVVHWYINSPSIDHGSHNQFLCSFHSHIDSELGYVKFLANGTSATVRQARDL